MHEDRTDASWHLVQCKPREDDRALENLQRQDFECYRPIYARERERVRQGRRLLTQAPLFPGYLFIRLDRLHDNWLPICSTRGVVHGDRVVITTGSFSGIEGIFMTSDGDERVILLLNILHTEQRLSFPIESVRRVRAQ